LEHSGFNNKNNNPNLYKGIKAFPILVVLKK